MTQEFYSNGKLLLSGEYAVLDGALAWAIPTKFGQYLRISSNSTKLIIWKSLDEKDNIWFEGTYDLETLKEVTATDHEISASLQNMLSQAQKLNPDFLSGADGFSIETVLTFPRDWGLGSSSTLINNIAQWSHVDTHELLANTFGGSGYDIACAKHNKPILYALKDKSPVIKELDNTIAFSESLYFVYLNKKKNSRDGIAAYRERNIDIPALIEQITKLTNAMSSCTTITDFEKLMTTHENLLSKTLDIPTVKSTLFSDYKGAIKSLGAWGGDFILVTGDKNTPDYFKNKGYSVVLPYQKMIL